MNLSSHQITVSLRGQIKLRYPYELDIYFKFIKISDLICELKIGFDMLYNSAVFTYISSFIRSVFGFVYHISDGVNFIPKNAQYSSHTNFLRQFLTTFRVILKMIKAVIIEIRKISYP